MSSCHHLDVLVLLGRRVPDRAGAAVDLISLVVGEAADGDVLHLLDHSGARLEIGLRPTAFGVMIV